MTKNLTDIYLEEIIEQSPYAIWISDNKGTIINTNNTLRKILKVENKDIIGKYNVLKDNNLVEQGVMPKVQAVFDEQISTRFTIQWSGLAMEDTSFKNSPEIWIDVSMSPIQDKNGNLVNVVCQWIDITKEKHSRDLLSQSEENLSLIFNNIGTGIVIYRVEDNGHSFIIKDINPAGARSSKVKRDEIIGKNVVDVFPGVIEMGLYDIFKRVWLSGKQENLQTTLYQDENLLHWVKNFVTKLPSGDVLAVYEDFTERKSAKKALDASETKFREYIEHAPLGIFVVDSEGKYTDVNPGACNMLGYTRKQLLKLSIKDILVMQDDFKSFQHLRKEGQLSYEMELKKKDDSIIYVRLDAVAISDNHFIAFCTDITESRYAQQEITNLLIKTETQLQNLQALQMIDKAIINSFDLRLTLQIIVEQVKNRLNVSAVDVLLYDELNHELTYNAGTGFLNNMVKESKYYLGNSLVGKAVLENKILTFHDFSDIPDGFRKNLASTEGFVGYIAAPLIAKGQIVGALEIYNRKSISMEPEWIEFLEILAGQASIALFDSAQMHELRQSKFSLELAYDKTILGWSKTLELRDEETQGHTDRVTNLTLQLAQSFGISGKDLKYMKWGALLHDIGKIGVPDSILLKPGKLTDEEIQIMRQHPIHVHNVLSEIDFLKPALDIPYCHHERWDGSGYPLGLNGEEIPLAARIFAIVDVYDALLSDRPYRKAWQKEKVLKHLKNEKSKHFDPDVVDAFLKLLDGL